MTFKHNDFVLKINPKKQFGEVYLKNKKIGKIKVKANNQYLVLMYKKYCVYNDVIIKLLAHFIFKTCFVDVVTINQQEISKNNLYFINQYQTLLFDIDDTILSFQKAEKKALSLALLKVHIQPSKKMIEHYHQINIKYWKMVEENKISRDDCLILRFEEFLPLYHIQISASEFEDIYRFYLNKQAYIVKDARKVLTNLKKSHRIFAITNGVKSTQQYRIQKAKLESYFLQFFVSSDIGFHKPSIKYIDIVSQKIENFDANTTLIIGDSLSSDIKLGINAHIDTCWFNFEFKENTSTIQPKYTIYSLNDLILK